MPYFGNLDLQQFSDEETSNENARNALIDANEEEASRATTKVLNGEDVPTPSKGGNASTPLKKKKCSAKKRTKQAAKEDLDGGSSSKGKRSVPTEWQDYAVKILIAI